MANSPTAPPAPTPSRADEVARLLARARAGDEAALPDVRKLLQNPSAVAVLGGELAVLAEQSYIRAMAPTDLAFLEAVRRKLEVLRTDLMGESPTPVERLLVERVGACWLMAQDAEVRAAQAKNLSPRWATFYQDRIDRANKRLLAALKTLAQVRKLAVPAVQVNIAKRQVNVAAGTVVAPAAC